MIHMACEGILIGGLSLYFSKQLKHQHKEIEELKSIIAKNQASNEKRFEVVFNFLDNVNGGFMPSRPRQEDRVVQLPEGPAPSFVKSQKVNAAVVAQQKTTKKVKESYAPPREAIQEPELKRLPQKKKVTIQQPVEEPSVLTTITKKNAIKVKEDIDENVKQQLAKMNEECDPNDEDCTDDIQDEMGTLLEEDVMEESLDTDMDD